MATTDIKREVFETNRALEFFNEKELAMQIGSEKSRWPLILIRELIDNALDASESVRIAPEIAVEIGPDFLSVADKGPGLPDSVIEKSLDYMIRVSDKNHYISPTRGQLGNALKCVWAASYVATGESRVEVHTGRTLHTIEVKCDPIRQHPDIKQKRCEAEFVRKGTFIKMHWPDIASLISESEIAKIYKTYRLLNPHATFTFYGDTHEAQITDWRKWTSVDPTSAYWYTAEDLQDLVAAHVSGGYDKTVREFVSEFRGLSGTAAQKRLVDGVGLTRCNLSDLNGKVDALLAGMKEQTKPVNPKALGVIGAEHINKLIAGEGFRYKCLTGDCFVMEVAFSYDPESEDDLQRYIGLNFSPALRNPIDKLSYYLNRCLVDSYDPGSVFLHIACPKLNFTDRGKSRVALTYEMHEALQAGIKSVTREFTKAKKRARRDEASQRRAIERINKQLYSTISVKDAAYNVMQDAYMQASGNGTYPANARQIMYAARPSIIEWTKKPSPWTNSSYFTQTLLPNFMSEYPELTQGWDVVFDDRGHFVEPHTECKIGLGTLAVRSYIKSWLDRPKLPGDMDLFVDLNVKTRGPACRYKYVLFIEKEGFMPLLDRAGIANRYDLAVMSTKGMSVTAARMLVDKLSAQDVVILVLHDFDKSGFAIVNSLRTSNRRFEFKQEPNMVDLGLRLTDVREMNLQSETVEYKERDPTVNLMQNGASDEEIDFLVQERVGAGWRGERVELNAMTSDRFIAFLERKLAEAGVTKVIPDVDVLEEVYQKARKIEHINSAIEEAIEGIRENFTCPPDLRDRVARYMEENKSACWDDAMDALRDDEF